MFKFFIDFFGINAMPRDLFHDKNMKTVMERYMKKKKIC